MTTNRDDRTGSSDETGDCPMADVFISYSRKDADFMRRLHAALSAQQRDVWVDWEDIPLTANWWQEICAAIEAADTFIFIISPDSIASEVCRNEIEHAVQNNKRFIPLLYRDISGVDKNLIHRAVQAHNWILFNDAANFDAAFQNLLQALSLDLDHVRKHTLLLVRAKEWEGRGRSPDYLLTGAETVEYGRWLEAGREKDPKPTELQLDFILASQAARSRRQLRFLGGALAVLVALLALSLIVFAQNQTLAALNAQGTVGAGERTRIAQDSTIAAQGTQQSLAQAEATRAARSTQSSLELARLNATIFAQATQRGIERTQQAATSAAQETRVAQSAADAIGEAERLILTTTLQAERALATAAAQAQQTQVALLLAQGQATAYAANLTLQAVLAAQTANAGDFSRQIEQARATAAAANATLAAALTQQAALLAENASLLDSLNGTAVALGLLPPGGGAAAASGAEDEARGRPLVGALRAVTLANAALRSAPSAAAPVSGALPAGTVVTVVSVSADGAWYRAQLDDGAAGWLPAALVGVQREVTAVAQAAFTATLTPAPSASPTLTPSATATAAPTSTPSPSATPTPPPPIAGQWFVSPAGSDANACYNPAVPCRTIGAALALAAPGDTVNLAVGVYAERLRLTRPVTLAGSDRQYVVISGDGQGTVITVAAPARVTLSGLTVTGGRAPDNGGGILNYGDLTLRDARVAGNIADGGGGGVANFGALTVSDSALEDNFAGAAGGAIFNAAGASLTLDEATVSFAGSADAAGSETAIAQQPADAVACPALTLAALRQGQWACGPLAPGQVCIANPVVETEAASADLAAGDAPAGAALRLSPLNRAEGTWGIALVGAENGGLLVAFGATRALDPAWPIGQPALVHTPANTLNLREAPGLASRRVTEMPNETRVVIVGGPQQADGLTWWRVRLEDGTVGWAADKVQGIRTLIVLSPEPITIGDMLAIAATSLKLRERPGLRSPERVTLVRGFDLLVLDGPASASGLMWWRVRSPRDGDGRVAAAVDGQATVTVQARGPRAGGAEAYLFPAGADAACQPVPLAGVTVRSGRRVVLIGDRLAFE
ncbi:MAG: TIR domain-containing protein [Aggregatilineales bacterium]